MYMYLKSEPSISGSGVSFTVEGQPDLKFAQKGCIDKLYSDAEFQRAFADVSFKALQSLLSQRTFKDEDVEKNNTFDINKIVLEMNNAAMAA